MATNTEDLTDDVGGDVASYVSYPRLATNADNEVDVFSVVGINDGNSANDERDTIQLLHIDP